MGASSQEPSDQSLLRRFRSGEQDAATRLYLRYAKRLHGLATAQTGADLNARLDPEDIVQSIFRTFFRRAYEGHYEVPDGEELWKLFLVIGLHKIRDAAAFHRAGKRSVDRTIGMSFSSGDLDPAAPDGFAEQTLRLVIDDLLKSLSDLREAQTADAFRNLAMVLSEYLKRPEDAIQVQTNALLTYSDDPYLWVGRAVLHARAVRREQALHDATAALARSKEPLVIYSAACVYTLTSEQAHAAHRLGGARRLRS